MTDDIKTIHDTHTASSEVEVLEATPAAIAKAAAAILDGQLVAFPTETVYGLGADATNAAAVASIFRAKGRPDFNPLISHCATIEQINEIAVLEGPALELAEIFWPGPLTLVLPRRDNNIIADIACAGLDTVAVRIPSGKIARSLLKQVGRPIAAPSANASGKISSTMAEHVMESLGDNVDMILDHGKCTVGVESTIISVVDGELQMLRPGGLTVEAIEIVSGLTVHHPEIDADAPNAPGQLTSHYAPNNKIRLNAITQNQGEAFLAFGPEVPDDVTPTLNLSLGGKLDEAALNLFAMLRSLDDQAFSGIAVMGIPKEGMGAAINDRLNRAAAPQKEPDA
jgi:L-threonylcarbamoyladenylate synthase